MTFIEKLTCGRPMLTWYPVQVQHRDWGCHFPWFWECCQLRTLAQSLSGHCSSTKRTPLPEISLSFWVHPAPNDGRVPWSWDFCWSPALPLPKSASIPLCECRSQVYSPLNLLFTNLCLRVYFLRPIRGHKAQVWKTYSGQISKEIYAEVFGYLEEGEDAFGR